MFRCIIISSFKFIHKLLQRTFKKCISRLDEKLHSHFEINLPRLANQKVRKLYWPKNCETISNWFSFWNSTNTKEPCISSSVRNSKFWNQFMAMSDLGEHRKNWANNKSVWSQTERQTGTPFIVVRRKLWNKLNFMKKKRHWE